MTDLIRSDDIAPAYRFGSTDGKRFRVHARSALKRFNGTFRTLIEAIANSKLRRMQRELELRGIRFDRRTNDWVVRTEWTERSQ